MNTAKHKRLTNQEIERIGVWGSAKIPPYWEELRNYVFKRDGHRCSRCHKVFKDKMLDAHHIIWRENGGSDNPKNLTTVCTPCHDLKLLDLPESWHTT